jgi:hypothetical protein
MVRFQPPTPNSKATDSFLPNHLQVLGARVLLLSAVLYSMGWWFTSAFPIIRLPTESFYFFPFLLIQLIFIPAWLLNFMGLFILHRLQPSLNRKKRLISLVLYGGVELVIVFYYVILIIVNVVAGPESSFPVNIALFIPAIFAFASIVTALSLIGYSIYLLLAFPVWSQPLSVLLLGRWACWFLIGGGGFQLIREILFSLNIFTYLSQINLFINILAIFASILIIIAFLLLSMLMRNI